MAVSMSDTRTATIRRLTEDRRRWRVLVEAWPDREMVRGRLVFRAEDTGRWDHVRESAALLHGRTMEDVLSLAHELSEDRLLRVLHSLG